MYGGDGETKMKLPNIAKATGLGALVLVLSAGAALSAVATTSVNVRTGPSTGFRAVDTLFPGEPVAIVGRQGGWCAVEKVGADGWVRCSYLAGIENMDVWDGPDVNLRIRPPRPSAWWGIPTPRISLSLN